MKGVGVGATLASACALLAFPAASAATSTVSSGGNVLVGSQGADQIDVAQVGFDLVITDPAGVSIDGSASNCTPNSSSQATCTGPVPGLSINGGDGDDTIDVAVQPPQSLVVWGGSGSDRIDASRSGVLSSTPALAGAGGNDTVIGTAGGDAIDSLVQGYPGSGIPSGPSGLAADPPDAGDDHLIGGPGDDFINPGRGADVAEGGDGNDNISTLVTPWDRRTDTIFDYPLDNATDQISCGNGADRVTPWAADQAAIDCETVFSWASCPQGTTCDVAPTITTGTGGAAASAGSTALAARKKNKTAVVGRGRRVKLKPGQSLPVNLALNARRVASALGNRTSIPATIQLGVRRFKHGRQVGQTHRRLRIRLGR
jgi:Ca2+-binding RTX toxin-like protein